MIAYPEILSAPAEEAGIKVPPDVENFDKNEFPHFQVYLNVQLGASMPYPTVHWDNAKIIASVSDEEIKTITFARLEELGVSIGYAIP